MTPAASRERFPWTRSYLRQRGAILGRCGRRPLVRYYHDQQKGISEMAVRKSEPTPGTPNARHGGEATKAKYGTEYYSRLGKKGGAVVKETYGPDHYSEIGTKGGAVTNERHGNEHYSRIGAMGGNAGKRQPDAPERPQSHDTT